MDSKGRLAKEQKEEYTLEELFDLYKKGFQLVSFGNIRKVQVPGLGVLTFKKYPSGDEYCVRPNGSMEKVNDAWFKKLERLVAEERANDEKRENKQLQKESNSIISNNSD